MNQARTLEGTAIADELEPYFRSGNDVPVERATIPAELAWRVIEALRGNGKLPQTKTNSPKWQRVACPDCGASIGMPCLNMFGAKAKRIHRARME